MRNALLVIVFAIRSSEAIAQTADPPIWNGVYSTIQAERGRTVFTAHCARCHGTNRSLSDEVFMLHWEGHTLARLFRKIKETMPPGSGTGPTDSEKLDTLAYILQQNRFPEGEQDLSNDEPTLEATRILPRGGPRPMRTGALVEVVGCLLQTPESSWKVTSATEPEPTALEKPRDSLQNPGIDRPPGTQTFQLLSPYPNPAPHAGRKVQVKGLLIRNPTGDRINVMALEPLADTCAQ